MTQSMTPARLKQMLDTQATYALIDVREAGEYNTAHIPGASLVPRRQLEFRMPRLVPFLGTPVIVYDDDGARARLAASTLERMGYRQVMQLEGGMNRWATMGYAAEWGVNVLSKDFGEKMQVQHHVPEMHPEELYTRIQQGERLIILDSRTPEEHRRSTIPGSRSAPSGELALRITDLVQDPEATVVVHCAGRTRSIVGARLLQRMGLRHVYDLRNGTMGWCMAGFELEHGSQRLALPAPSPAGLAAAEAFTTRIAAEDGVRFLTIPELQARLAQANRDNVYLIDVRTIEEFAQGHIPGFQWFPGGQAVQRSDDVVAVRTGQVIFTCDDRVRATVAASWYRQLGFPNVFVVDGGTRAWAAHGLSLEQSARPGGPAGYDEGLVSEAVPFGYTEARQQVELLDPPALQARLAGPQPPLVLFVETSRDFSQGHVPGARWLSRSWLELQIADLAPSKETAIVVTCTNGHNAMLAGGTLQGMGYTRVAVLTDGMRAWRTAGLPVEQGLSGVMNPPSDVLLMGTDRTWADAIHYLQWEEELGKKYETPHA